MKKELLLMVGGFMGLALNAAYETTPDGLTWKYEIKGDKAVIVCREDTIKTGTYPYEKTVTVYIASISSNTVGAVSIPETLGGCPVVSIGHDAFNNCKKITSLSIPHSITNIGNWTWGGEEPRKGGAFSGCSGFTEIHIDDLSMMYSGIKFQNASDTPFCNSPNANLYVGGELITEAVITNGSTEINDYAFYDWQGLSRITIPQSVTNIGNSAFYNCKGLSQIAIPQSVANIGNYAFYNCNGLREIAFALPPNLGTIGEAAFAGCDNLASVSIPSSVVDIGEAAFNCGRLTGLSLELPKVDYGRELTSIVEASRVTNLIINAEISSMPPSVATFTNLVNITIPSSVTYLPKDYFSKCLRLNAEWTKTIANLSTNSIGMETRYDLSDYVADRSIASISIDGDSAIDEFVLVEGKVYDVAIRIVNTAATAVHITLPPGYTYESFVGAAPLTLPAKSTNMLTITRTGDKTFLVARRQLQTIAQ